MMDDRADTFGAVQYPAAQYPVTYSNFTLDDNFLNSIGEMNNAAPLISIFFPSGPFPTYGHPL